MERDSKGSGIRGTTQYKAYHTHQRKSQVQAISRDIARGHEQCGNVLGELILALFECDHKYRLKEVLYSAAASYKPLHKLIKL